ncbi:MAG: Flp pilus assembly complex ATPase component TadA [Betaproteobacteria bacterium]|nr:Flp pilus assembly complex ATPase component TadA [Betaproteobacteria bacterium]
MTERSYPAATGSDTAVEEFQWPAPPYFEFVWAEDRCGLGECLLILRDGEMATGRLHSFLTDESLLTFQADGSSETLHVPFSALLKLQLLQPLGLRRETLPSNVAETEDLPRSERQPFWVELVNGEKFQGMTRGHLSALCGLFLYLEGADGGVMRCFIPAQATKSCNIGAPIGQILIDQDAVTPEAVGVALNMQSMMRTQRLGQFLTENRFVSPDQLAAALNLKRENPSQRLGEALLELGFLSKPELEMALESDARDRSMPIGEILQKKMGIVDEKTISGAMANKLGIPLVNLAKVTIPQEILNKIPAAIAHRRRIVPLCEAEGALFVAIENPMDNAVLEELRTITRMKVRPVAATGEEIADSLMTHYGAIANVGIAATTTSGRNLLGTRTQPAIELAAENEAGVQELIARLAAESGNLDSGEQQAVKSDSALVKLVNRMILDAVEQKASDIHIEANLAPKTTRIRFRKDGTLVNYLELPAPFRNAVVSRIKIMSQLDITERRKPQDGKIDFGRFGPAPVELRVATIPTTRGLEDVVMRVLAAATPVPVDELGLDEKTLRSLKKLISSPHGLFLVCGPTGSGKTTTLHSLLAFLNTPERKIWTAEDPIEITQPGLRQVQVNAKIGWTFAVAMRSFMRADPDIIMVGEMRDAETAKIGIEASLTGHLLLSTLHTNSAPESIVRLLDLGMDPFNFADALLGVLAERLAKRLCPKCKLEYTPTSAEIKGLAAQYCDETSIQPGKQVNEWLERYGGATGKISLFRARGCAHCDRTGYRGRIGLYELLLANAAVKRLVQTRAPLAEVKNAATAAGMRTLRQDGIEKILQGLTDIQQVSSVSV